jgi:hypothetical protein
VSDVLVYCQPDDAEAGVRRRDDLRAEGHRARVIWIMDGVGPRACDWVEIIGTPDIRVTAVYGDKVRDASSPAPSGTWAIQQRGTWWSVVGPDGEKHGPSVRSEAEALELMREAEDGGNA